MAHRNRPESAKGNIPLSTKGNRLVSAKGSRPDSAKRSRPESARGHPGEQIPTMQKPLPFIETTKDGLFHVNPKVIKILQRVDKPVSAIAIAGKYRTGKSYLMNRLYGKNSGFPLGGAIQSKTKGIWIWARPHPDDSSRCMILLDTEGLYDVEKGDETHDLKIFSLALLLSSCFVFNVVGAIGDEALQQLHLVSELTKHITTGNAQEKDNESEEDFSRYFPHFVLVLRDFFLSLEINGKLCTPDEYLEHALKLKPGVSAKVKTYNQPRECLREYFPNRNCYVLPRPVDSDLKLKNIDKVPVVDLRPEFLNKSEVAIKGIMDAGREFKISNNIITGKRFVALAQMYVEAMNSGGVPNIESSVELLKNRECQQALEEAMKYYKEHMETHVIPRLPLMVNELSLWHKDASASALEIYKKRALFDEEGVFINKFMLEIQQAYDNLIKKNEDQSQRICQQFVEQSFHSLNENVKNSKYTSKSGGYSVYLQDRNMAVQRYDKMANKGPLGSTVIEQYLASKETEEKTILHADQALSEGEKSLAEEKARRQREEQAAKALEERNLALLQKMEDENQHNQKVLQNTREEFESKISEQQKQQNKLISQKEKELERLQKEGSDRAAAFQINLEQMKQENLKLSNTASSVRNEILQIEQKYGNLLKQHQSSQSSSAAQIKSLQEQLLALQQARGRPRRRKGKCSIM